jgi:hypothetical protein
MIKFDKLKEKKMNPNKTTTEEKDVKVKISTLWVLVMFNMLAADILSFMYPGSLKEIMTGYRGEIQITPGFLFLAAVMIEIPIVMTLLSLVLKYRINRLANIIAGLITIAFVIGGGSTTPHYIFLATMEVVFILLIIWFAWKWTNPEDKPQ